MTLINIPALLSVSVESVVNARANMASRLSPATVSTLKSVGATGPETYEHAAG